MEVKAEVRDPKVFMSVEVVLGLFILYPHLRKYLEELILPESDFALCLYGALKEAPEGPTLTEEMLNIPEEHRERTKILQLYCENHFMGWSDTLAIQEICSNCSQRGDIFCQSGECLKREARSKYRVFDVLSARRQMLK